MAALVWSERRVQWNKCPIAPSTYLFHSNLPNARKLTNYSGSKVDIIKVGKASFPPKKMGTIPPYMVDYLFWSKVNEELAHFSGLNYSATNNSLRVCLVVWRALDMEKIFPRKNLVKFRQPISVLF